MKTIIYLLISLNVLTVAKAKTYTQLCSFSGSEPDEKSRMSVSQLDKHACCDYLEAFTYDKMKEQVSEEAKLTGYENKFALRDFERMRISNSSALEEYKAVYKKKSGKDWLPNDKCTYNDCDEFPKKEKSLKNEICRYVGGRKQNEKMFESEKAISEATKSEKNPQLIYSAHRLVESKFYIDRLKKCYKENFKTDFDESNNCK